MKALGSAFGLAVVLLSLAGCRSSQGSPPEPAPAPECIRVACSLGGGKGCGVRPDGCGGLLDCGGCPSGQTCGGGGSENVCGSPGCVPRTCAQAGKNCGAIADGCGGELACGACADGESCGAGGRPNVCGTIGGSSTRACSKDGFCWMSPVPMGFTLKDTWGAAPNDLWAVGEGGQALHWDGARLSLLPVGVELSGIWGSKADDIWAVGDGILRWDGSSWTKVLDGSGGWLHDVWGTSANDVWAVGEGGRVLHWDGARWTPVSADTQRTLRRVWASGPRDVWIAGAEGEVRRFDGRTWTALPKPGAGRAVVALFGGAPGEVWAGTEVNGMYRWTASGWVRTPFPGTAWALWGTGPNDLWAAGEYDADDGNQRDDGFVAHWSGTAWSVRRELPPVLGIWGTAGAQWFVGRQGSVLLRKGGAWQPVSSPAFRVDGAFSAGANDVWFVSSRNPPDSVFTHWDGTAFTTQVSPFGPGGFKALGGSSGTDLWAVGDADYVGHWDGKTWTRVDTGLKNLNLTGVWASGPNDAWVVGSFQDTGGGLTLHWDGTRWARSLGAHFQAVWGSAPDDVWAVGPRAIAHFDGKAWSFVPPPKGDAGRFPFFLSVWGSGRNDVWAAGFDEEDARNQLWRWDGRSWSRMVHPEVRPERRSGEPALLSIAGTGPTNVFLTGTGNTALHWNGQAWTGLDTGLSPEAGDVLEAVLVAGPDVWIAGRDGAVLRRAGK